MKFYRPMLFVIAASLSAVPGLAYGQEQPEWDPGKALASRAELQALLEKYETHEGSSAYSDRVRTIVKDEAELIRVRLEEGDFQVGDEIILTVGGQPTLSNTFKVAPGRVIMLPDIGAVPLTGILRSELQDSLRAYLSKYVRDPQVYAQSAMRLQVFGAVGKPGYYAIPAESLLTDALMMAGGPGNGAKQEDMKIRRGDDVIWEDEPLQEAIIEGRTLDQLNLRAGDIIEVPGGTQGRDLLDTLRKIAFTLPLIYAVTRIF